MALAPLASRPRLANRTSTKPTLRPGSKGASVKTLQQNLHKHGYGNKVGTADGDYGPKTKAAVTAFQNDRIKDLDRRIGSASSDSEAIRLTQERNGIKKDLAAGVAGDATQQALAGPKSNTAPSNTSGAPTPPLPSQEATTAVGGDTHVSAPQTQPTGAPATTPQTTSGLSNKTYTVKSGDSMSKIANNHNVTLGQLTQANPQVSDPNKIAVGQTLNIPSTAKPAPTSPSPAEIDKQTGVSYDDKPVASPAPTTTGASPAEIDKQTGVSYDDKDAPSANTYTVKSGDTMSKIASNHDVTLGELVSANPQVKDPNVISVGEKLNIPAKAQAAPAPTTPSTTPAPAEIDRTTGVEDAKPKTALEVSKEKTDALKRDFRAAQEHGREPDLSTAKGNLAAHLEGDYIPKLEARQSSLSLQQARATEHGQPTAKLNAEREANAAELQRANTLLDEAKGAPITSAQPDGIFSGVEGVDAQTGNANLTGSFSDGTGTYSVSAATTNTTSPEVGGDRSRTLEITKTREADVGISGDIGVVGAEASVFAGQSTSYTLTIPEEHYQKVVSGQVPFPDPGNISTMPPNSSATLRAEDVAGASAGGSYGAFSVGSSGSSSSGNSVGVQVAGNGDVRVMAGPTDAVNNSHELGLGGTIGFQGVEVGAELTLGNSNTLRNTELKFVDLDRNSGQGAFSDFIRTGNVPPASATGVKTGGTISQTDITSETSVGISGSIGPFDLGTEATLGSENTN